jgi:Protein of unknown function (DUF2829)
MGYEDEILERYSTPRLRRNVLPREAKKLNMEFDGQYAKWSKAERDAFLDRLYPNEVSHDESINNAQLNFGCGKAFNDPGSHHPSPSRQDQEGCDAGGAEDGSPRDGRAEVSRQIPRADAGAGQPGRSGRADGRARRAAGAWRQSAAALLIQIGDKILVRGSYTGRVVWARGPWLYIVSDRDMLTRTDYRKWCEPAPAAPGKLEKDGMTTTVKVHVNGQYRATVTKDKLDPVDVEGNYNGGPGEKHFYLAHPANSTFVITEKYVDDADKRPAEKHPAFNTIGWAVKEMQNGRKVRRSGWNGKGMHIAIEWGTEKRMPLVYMLGTNGLTAAWNASQVDLLATDWEIAE